MKKSKPASRKARGPKLKTSLAEAGPNLILETLDRHNGNRTKTAKELGISVTTPWRRMQEIS